MKSEYLSCKVVTPLSPQTLSYLRISLESFFKKEPKTWCLGRESNSYGPFGPQDFKSYSCTFLSWRFHTYIYGIIKKRVITPLGMFRLESALFGYVCHLGVTRKLFGLVPGRYVAEYYPGALSIARQRGHFGHNLSS